MGIVRFDIELDNSSKTYLNGDVITGKVYLDIDSPKTVKVIKLTVFGEGKISWQQTRFALEVKDVYPAEFVKEVYIDDDNILLGLDGPTVIPAGQHVYPFSYKLPVAIPSSYEDEYSEIVYKVKVTIQRAWYLWNHRESVDFIVAVPLDLNNDSKAAEPVRESITKTFMGCTNPVDMTVSLPVRGYVPEQTIPITVDIKNGAKVMIKGIYFTLIKLSKYHGKSKIRPEEEVLLDHETHVGNESDTPTQIQHFLKIPLTQPSYLNHAKLIDLEYLIRVEVRVGGLHKNFELDVPIIIGTAGLLNSTVAMSQGVTTQQNNETGKLERRIYPIYNVPDISSEEEV